MPGITTTKWQETIKNMTETNKYIVAMLNHDTGRLEPLFVGRTYGRMAASMRADELNKKCQEELMLLGYDSFVAYNLIVDKD